MKIRGEARCVGAWDLRFSFRSFCPRPPNLFWQAQQSTPATEREASHLRFLSRSRAVT